MRRIRFQGREWLLASEPDGAICTRQQYERGECSYAHLFADGRIMRFNRQIGTRDDIEFLGNAKKPEVTGDGFINVLFSKWGPGGDSDGTPPQAAS